MEISRLRDNKKSYASFIDFANNEQIVYCERCNSVGIKSRLGPRVLEANEVEPTDYHQWQECYTCGKIVNIQRDVKHESKIIEAINIDNKPIFASMQSKKCKHNVGIKRYSSNLGKDKDPEIQALLDKGADITIHQ